MADFYGTSGNDTLVGTEEDDFLWGAAGDDTLHGNGGDDIIAGWDGNDTAYGGDGDDLILGHAGNDLLYGGAGNDYFRGGSGVDYYDGGDDLGDQIVSGTLGVLGDRISFYELDATQGVIVDLRTGVISNDGFGNVEHFVGIESLGGGTAFADQFYGTDGGNWISAGPGDTVMSFGGNDWFQLEGALAILDGGTGIDTINVFTSDPLRPDSNGDGRAEQVPSTQGVVVDLLAGTMSDEFGSGTIAGIENVGGSYLNDTITGDANDNVLAGHGGDDTLSGGGGNDTILGGPAGSDLVSGGGGNDTVSYGHNAQMDPGGEEGSHYTYLYSSDRTTSLGGVIVDLAAGVAMGTTRPSETNQLGEYLPPSGTASGTDTIIGTDQLSGIENITGSGLGDRLSGDDNANIIAPGAGDDIVDGRGGIDTVDYTSARGALNVNLAQGVATQAGSGAAPLRYFVSTSTGQLEVVVHADDAQASTDTLAGIENVYGSALSDTIVGNGQSNFLAGNDGDDIVRGGGGHDSLRGGQGADQLFGGTSDDFLYGNAGDDLIDGGDGHDRAAFSSGATAGVTVDLNLQGRAQNTGQGMDTLVGIEHVSGTRFNDVITGDSADNWLWGGSDGSGVTGNDTISAGAGNDLVQVGTGNHTLAGGVGNDTLSLHGNGTDITTAGVTVSLGLQGRAQNTEQGMMTISGFENISGSAFADRLTGNAASNVLAGFAGDDILRGGGGNDTLYGDGAIDPDTHGIGTSGPITTSTDLGDVGGNDYLNGGAGADRMVGGAGNDTYAVDSTGDVVTELAGRGTDTILVGFSYLLPEHVEVLTLTGTSAINGTGNGLANILNGNSAANRLNGGAGADTMRGRGGNDTYIVDNLGDRAIEGSSTGGTDVVRSSVTFALGAHVENLVLTGSNAINGTGNGLANLLNGNSARNILDGGAGADSMRGGGGNDTYIVDNVGDRAIEGSSTGGTDEVKSSVSFALGGYIERLVLTGTNAINGTGNGLKNILIGNSAANLLNGRGGADSMRGGGGNDTYIVDNVGDRAIEGSATGGTDLVRSSVSFALGGYVERLTLTGSNAINGTGNGMSNILIGNGAANILDGRGGADTMRGGAGNDTYIVDNSRDSIGETATGGTDVVYSSASHVLATNVEHLTLTGTARINGSGNGLDNIITGNSADNVLNGGGGADRLSGGDGADRLDGGNGSDRVEGGNGNDAVSGGAGNDMLVGGAGSDMFRFDSALDPFVNVDGITDFSVADDTIQLSRSVFSAFTSNGVLDASAFRAGTNAQDADDRIIYDSATGRIYYDADGMGGAAQVLFTTVLAGTALTHADFVIVG